MNKLYIPCCYCFSSIQFSQKLEMTRELEQPSGIQSKWAISLQRGLKTSRIIKSLSKESRKKFGEGGGEGSKTLKLVIMVNFCNEEATFIVFYVKYANKPVPYCE